MVGPIRLGLKIVLYTVFLVVIKSISADEQKAGGIHGIIQKADFANSLKTYINDTIESDRIRDKLYHFFEDLSQSQTSLNRSLPLNKTVSSEYYLIELVSHFSKSPSRRRKREDDCREARVIHAKTLKMLEREVNFIESTIFDEPDEIKEHSCQMKCMLECRKNNCLPSNCPEIPKDLNKCSDPVPCPRGCTAHWTIPPPRKDLKEVKKKEKEEGLKKKAGNKVNHKVSAGRKKSSNRIGADVDDLTKVIDYHRGLSYGFRRLEALLEDESGKFSSQDKRLMDLGDKLRLESVVDMVELLDYFKEDITYLSGGFLYDYSKIASIYYSQPNKSRLIMDCIKSILGHVVPNLSEEEIRRLKLSRLGDLEVTTNMKIWEWSKDEDRLKLIFTYCNDKSCSKYCPEHLDDLEKCSFKCANNQNCGQYQCFCKRYWRDVIVMPKY